MPKNRDPCKKSLGWEDGILGSKYRPREEIEYPVPKNDYLVTPLHEAFDTLVDNSDPCKQSLDWEVGILVSGSCKQSLDWEDGILGIKYRPREENLGVPLLHMEDTDGDLKFAEWKDQDDPTWVQTGLHAQAWKAIQSTSVYKSGHFTIKSTCDAVEDPCRVAKCLMEYPMPRMTGLNLEDTDGDLKFAEWKDQDDPRWGQTGLHAQAWKAIQSASVYKSGHFTIKSTCDAVEV